jgi:phosphatidylinositol glycan class P protein
LSSIETIIDDAANIATIDGKGRMERSHMGGKEKTREKRDRGDRDRERSTKDCIKDWKALWSVGTDAVMDVPLGGVCEVLYGDFREEDDDEED